MIQVVNLNQQVMIWNIWVLIRFIAPFSLVIKLADHPVNLPDSY